MKIIFDDFIKTVFDSRNIEECEMNCTLNFGLSVIELVKLFGKKTGYHFNEYILAESNNAFETLWYIIRFISEKYCIEHLGINQSSIWNSTELIGLAKNKIEIEI